MVKGPSGQISVVIQITMLNVSSEIRPLHNKVGMDFDEIFMIALQLYKEQLIIFWGDLNHHADYPN